MKLYSEMIQKLEPIFTPPQLYSNELKHRKIHQEAVIELPILGWDQNVPHQFIRQGCHINLEMNDEYKDCVNVEMNTISLILDNSEREIFMEGVVNVVTLWNKTKCNNIVKRGNHLKSEVLFGGCVKKILFWYERDSDGECEPIETFSLSFNGIKEHTFSGRELMWRMGKKHNLPPSYCYLIEYESGGGFDAFRFQTTECHLTFYNDIPNGTLKMYDQILNGLSFSGFHTMHLFISH